MNKFEQNVSWKGAVGARKLNEDMNDIIKIT